MVLDPQKIRYLVVHCSDTDADLTAADIHALHLDLAGMASAIMR